MRTSIAHLAGNLTEEFLDILEYHTSTSICGDQEIRDRLEELVTLVIDKCSDIEDDDDEEESSDLEYHADMDLFPGED